MTPKKAVMDAIQKHVHKHGSITAELKESGVVQPETDYAKFLPEGVHLTERHMEFLQRHNHETDAWGLPVELIAALDDENAALSDLERMTLKWYVSMYMPVTLYKGEELRLEGEDLVSVDAWVKSQGCFYAYLRWFHYSLDPEDLKIKKSPWVVFSPELNETEVVQVEQFGRAIACDLQAHKYVHFTKLRQVWATGGTSALHVWDALKSPGGLFYLTKTDREAADEQMKERDWHTIKALPIAERHESGHYNEERVLITEPFVNGRVIKAKYTENRIELKETTGAHQGYTCRIIATACTESSYLGNPCQGIRLDEYAKWKFRQKEVMADALPNTFHGNCRFVIPTTNYGYNYNYRKLHDIADDSPVGGFSDAYKNRRFVVKGYSTWENGSGFHCIEIDINYHPLKIPCYTNYKEPFVAVGRHMFDRFIRYYSKLNYEKEKLSAIVRLKDTNGRNALLLRENWFVKQLRKYGDTGQDDFEREILLEWNVSGGRKMFPEFNPEFHTIRKDDARVEFTSPVPYSKVYVCGDIGPGNNSCAGWYQVLASCGYRKWREYHNPERSFTEFAHDIVQKTKLDFPNCSMVFIHDEEGGSQTNSETLMSYGDTFVNMGIEVIVYSIKDYAIRINNVKEAFRRLDKNGQSMYQIDSDNCPVTIAAYQGGYVRDRYKGSEVYKDTPTKEGVYSHHMDCDQLFMIHMRTIMEDFDDSYDEPMPEMTEREKRFKLLGVNRSRTETHGLVYNRDGI